MTPFEFGYKIAADMQPAKPSVFGAAAPGANPAGYDIRTDDQARMWQNHGSPFGPRLGTSPVRVRPKSAPVAPNPEHQQILTNLGKQYPQFGQGDLQDMLSLHLQNRGGDLAKFTRNTQNMYKQNPTRAANFVPPPPTPQRSL